MLCRYCTVVALSSVRAANALSFVQTMKKVLSVSARETHADKRVDDTSFIVYIHTILIGLANRKNNYQPSKMHFPKTESNTLIS